MPKKNIVLYRRMPQNGLESSQNLNTLLIYDSNMAIPQLRNYKKFVTKLAEGVRKKLAFLTLVAYLMHFKD